MKRKKNDLGEIVIEVTPSGVIGVDMAAETPEIHEASIRLFGLLAREIAQIHERCQLQCLAKDGQG